MSFQNQLKKEMKELKNVVDLVEQYPISSFDPRLAVYNKKCLKYLIQKGMQLDIKSFLPRTKSNRISRSTNTIDTVPENTAIMESAAKIGKLKIMRLLLKHHCQFDEHTFVAAAKRGKLNNLIWLKKHKCPWNAAVFAAALDCGRVENVQWLFQKKCPIGGAKEFACEVAANNGNLELLQWLVEHSFTCDELVMERAALQGDVEMISYLLTQNCPIDAESLEAAMKSENKDAIKLLTGWMKNNV